MAQLFLLVKLIFFFFLSKNILLFSPLLSLDLSERVGFLLLQISVFKFPSNMYRVDVGQYLLRPHRVFHVHKKAQAPNRRESIDSLYLSPLPGVPTAFVV